MLFCWGEFTRRPTHHILISSYTKNMFLTMNNWRKSSVLCRWCLGFAWWEGGAWDSMRTEEPRGRPRKELAELLVGNGSWRHPGFYSHQWPLIVIQVDDYHPGLTTFIPAFWGSWYSHLMFPQASELISASSSICSLWGEKMHFNCSRRNLG